MNRVIYCVLLFCALSSARSPITPTQSPYGPAAAGGIIPSVTPTTYPLLPSTIPPGYKNPYYPYNPTVGPAIPILSFTNDHGATGTYSYSFSTADGKQVQESGYLKDSYIDNAGEPQGTQVVQGSYSYIAPDGTPIQVSYIADENGFRPSGVHFPADRKTLPTLAPFVDGKIDPVADRYNPFYNNHFNRPYDHRYPYDPRYPSYNSRYPYDPRKYNPYYNNYNPFNPSLNPGLNSVLSTLSPTLSTTEHHTNAVNKITNKKESV